MSGHQEVTYTLDFVVHRSALDFGNKSPSVDQCASLPLPMEDGPRNPPLTKSARLFGEGEKPGRAATPRRQFRLFGRPRHSLG